LQKDHVCNTTYKSIADLYLAKNNILVIMCSSIGEFHALLLSRIAIKTYMY